MKIYLIVLFTVVSQFVIGQFQKDTVILLPLYITPDTPSDNIDNMRPIFYDTMIVVKNDTTPCQMLLSYHGKVYTNYGYEVSNDMSKWYLDADKKKLSKNITV